VRLKVLKNVKKRKIIKCNSIEVQSLEAIAKQYNGCRFILHLSAVTNSAFGTIYIKYASIQKWCVFVKIPVPPFLIWLFHERAVNL